MLPRSLISRKEEKLVRNDLAADGSAKLVAQQIVILCSGRGKCPRSRVKRSPAIKLEQIAVKGIRSRLGNQIHYAAWMQAIPRRQRTCLNAELLQCVREWERQIHIRESVIVVAAIEQVVCRVRLAAGDRNGLRAVEILASGFVSAWSHHRGARCDDELRGVPSV